VAKTEKIIDPSLPPPKEPYPRLDLRP